MVGDLLFGKQRFLVGPPGFEPGITRASGGHPTARLRALVVCCVVCLGLFILYSVGDLVFIVVLCFSCYECCVFQVYECCGNM